MHSEPSLMVDTDEADLAAERLESALDRIAAKQAEVVEAGAAPRLDPRVAAKLDNLIRALRSALDQ
jgi:hypothetical protein